MKRSAFVLSVLAFTTFVSTGRPQGTVIFNNKWRDFTGPLVDAPISDFNGNRIDGVLHGYLAALYAAPGANQPFSSLSIVANPINRETTIGFRTGVAAGYLDTREYGVREIPSAPFGSVVTLQIRVWSATYGTFEAAIASGDMTVNVGLSDPINVTTSASRLDPNIPGMIGLAGFRTVPLSGSFVDGIPVPEPAPIMLGLCGLAACWWLIPRHHA